MTEISLNIMDIVQNSIKAQANHIKIIIEEDTVKNFFKVIVEDNGVGMTKEFLKRVTDPYTTKNKVRKVGLGLSLLKAACEQTGGSFEIKSELGKKTWLCANFVHNSYDRQPLGDMATTMTTLILCNTKINFDYYHKYNDKEFTFRTLDVKKTLGDVFIGEQNVLNWINDYIKEGIEKLYS